ncbi:MAG: RNA-guided endonuclease InsQ/TnpB family protein [Heteroscytonema crispum UTEX LB 1556]
MKTYKPLPQVKPKSVTISRQADRWFISFRFDIEQQETENTSVVGVDLGVKALATLSTGEVVIGAKSYNSYETKLSRLQWLHRRKVKGSANWKKAQMQIARLHRKIANIRKDTLHKLTTLLAKNHGTVVIEDLNVSGSAIRSEVSIGDKLNDMFSSYKNASTPLHVVAMLGESENSRRH